MFLRLVRNFLQLPMKNEQNFNRILVIGPGIVVALAGKSKNFQFPRRIIQSQAN